MLSIIEIQKRGRYYMAKVDEPTKKSHHTTTTLALTQKSDPRIELLHPTNYYYRIICLNYFMYNLLVMNRRRRRLNG